jgi:hypothetical protein
MRKNLLAFCVCSLAALTLVSGCTTTETPTFGETGRPRIEQRALSNAIDIAFKNVNFGLVIGKKVFIDTQSLSKLDIPFINAYIAGIVMEKGGVVVQSEADADVKIFNVVKTSGTDDIKRRILSDRVRGEYKSVMSFIDARSKAIIRTYELSGEADENR